MLFLLIIVYGYITLALLFTFFIYRDQKNPKFFLGRNRKLAWTIIAILWIGIFLGLIVRWVTPYRLISNYQIITLQKIDHPITIAFVTDIHVGKHKKTAWTEKIVEKIEKERPDLVILGGDLISNEGTFEDETIYLEPLKKLVGKFPIYYIMGNHEYGVGNATRINFNWSTGNRSALLADRMKNLGIPELLNELACPEINNERICLYGIDDIWSGPINFKAVEENQKLLSSTTLLFLAHNPDGIMSWPKNIIKPDLTLSGHSHGGQIWIPGFGPLGSAGIQLGKEYYRGLNYFDDSPIFTSVGAGESGAPLRFWVTPEVVILKLLPKT